MPYSSVLEAEIEQESLVQTLIRPRLESFDSGPEFSLEHLRELYKMLDVEHDLDGYVFDDSCLRVD